jgi:hypothetical protein
MDLAIVIAAAGLLALVLFFEHRRRRAFYLSDLFVARQRFVAPAFANRLYGLPLYYLGQFLLAFSVGRIL